MAAQGQTINFHQAFNYPQIPGYAVLYVGQGAYSDPGNNIWNGFGAPGGPSSTWFYGGGNAWSGNVGNPYAAYGTPGTMTTTAGTVLFGSAGTTPPGTTPAGNATSAGALSPVTLSINYGFDNGANPGTVQGTPSWIFGQAACVNGNSPGAGTAANPMGVATLQNVPAGIYSLYLYAANYDNNRGASFAVSSGTPVNGVTNAFNSGVGSPANSFVLGQTYVQFSGVSPDPSGNITITWSAVSNPGTGFAGEGNFNGLQLVAAAQPPVLSITNSGGNVIISWSPTGGTLLAATNVAGPYTNVIGTTSPVTNAISGPAMFYRVKQ
jgi:hypothetical protein